MRTMRRLLSFYLGFALLAFEPVLSNADEALTARLKEGEAARLTQRKRVTFRKLTRAEYANNFPETPDAFFGTAL